MVQVQRSSCENAVDALGENKNNSQNLSLSFENHYLPATRTMWMIKVLLVVVLSSFVTLSNSQNVRVENFELSDANANSCDVIIEASRFDGDCCSMNSTQNNGCVLNIINGRCKVTGQYWTLDWTSTYSVGGAKCPPSEFPEFAPAAYETEAPAGGGEEPQDGASRLVGTAILSALAFGLVSLVI